VFDDFRGQLAANRSQFYLDVAGGPFYGFNRPGAKISQGAIWNWWRQGMAGGANAHYDGIKAFSETDFTDGRPTSPTQGVAALRSGLSRARTRFRERLTRSSSDNRRQTQFGFCRPSSNRCSHEHSDS
jgi:hypothetical protein